MSQGESCSNRRVGGRSRAPLGAGSTSREQFLGGLLASSAALLACTAAANAGETGAPMRQEKRRERACLVEER